MRLIVKGKGHPRTGHEGPEGEERYSSTLSFTSAIDGVGGERHVTAALPPPSGGRPGTHCIEGWVGSRAGLDGCGKSRPHQASIARPSSLRRAAIPTELCRPTFEYLINLLTPNVNYSGRTAPLTSKVVFYIFIQQI